MKAQIMGIILLAVTISSCSKEEELLLSVNESIKTSKVKLESAQEYPLLTDSTLILLKTHTDNTQEGSVFLDELMKKESSVKKMRKYLSELNGINSICSKMFIDHKKVQAIKKQCKRGYFDICPLSFGKYFDHSRKIIENLKKLIGERFSQTDCQNYMSKELYNE